MAGKAELVVFELQFAACLQLNAKGKSTQKNGTMEPLSSTNEAPSNAVAAAGPFATRQESHCNFCCMIRISKLKKRNHVSEV